MIMQNTFYIQYHVTHSILENVWIDPVLEVEDLMLVDEWVFSELVARVLRLVVM